jgi:hypothetical protein
MKGNFFEQFKNYLLKHHSDNLKTFIPYYETMLQAKDNIHDLLDDTEKYHLYIEYEEDKYDGYTDGELLFNFYSEDPNEDYGWESRTDHYYKMELRNDERHWGYCQCEPVHIGYNPIYNCCGNGCDWTAPQIHITKIESITYHAFEGVQRDMWELERQWMDSKVDYEEEKRLAHLKRLEEQIKSLEEEKQRYIK